MIRVVRIMEYVYETPEDMVADMSHWCVPAYGLKRWNSRCLIKSAVLPIELFGDKGVSDVELKDEGVSEPGN